MRDHTIPDTTARADETDRVTILMAVWNAGKTLDPQLHSILDQTHANWHILAADDGSSDDSPQTLARFAAAHPGRLTPLCGPRNGAARNFVFLLREAGRREGATGWIAFCDQDDVWLPGKLARGIAALSSLPEGQPALYCSRTWVTDFDLKARRLSAARPRPPGFRNALVQNIASGNTTLLNPAAAQLVCAAAQEVTELVVHDWWVYQLVTGAGGTVVHDDEPTLLYRQHPGNQIGANDHLRARLKRIGQLLRGDFREWNRVNIAALRASAHRLTPANRALLDRFAAAHDAPLVSRLRLLSGMGLYRQSRAAQLALWLAALLGRL
ncbi:glycosyltransferase [Rhodovulum bhavnagarense]|nr:glycosyltransferase [Rhodovulum bhavnagarense]